MRSEQKNWTLEQAKALADRLEASERSMVLNKRQLICEVMYPAITAKLKNGWTHQAVCEELAQLGIAITPNTLRSYLKGRSKTRRSATRSVASSNKVASSTDVPSATEISADTAPTSSAITTADRSPATDPETRCYDDPSS